jgi:hypothetical protein
MTLFYLVVIYFYLVVIYATHWFIPSDDLQ